jgi:hypothetical protein
MGCGHGRPHCLRSRPTVRPLPWQLLAVAAAYLVAQHAANHGANLGADWSHIADIIAHRVWRRTRRLLRILRLRFRRLYGMVHNLVMNNRRWLVDRLRYRRITSSNVLPSTV